MARAKTTFTSEIRLAARRARRKIEEWEDLDFWCGKLGELVAERADASVRLKDVWQVTSRISLPLSKEVLRGRRGKR